MLQVSYSRDCLVLLTPVSTSQAPRFYRYPTCIYHHVQPKQFKSLQKVIQYHFWQYHCNRDGRYNTSRQKQRRAVQIIRQDSFEVTVLGCLLSISLSQSAAGRMRSKQGKCTAHYAEGSQDPFQRGRRAQSTEFYADSALFSVWVTKLSANQLLPRTVRKTQKLIWFFLLF